MHRPYFEEASDQVVRRRLRLGVLDLVGRQPARDLGNLGRPGTASGRPSIEATDRRRRAEWPVSLASASQADLAGKDQGNY
jgi:hypothetical protein